MTTRLEPCPGCGHPYAAIAWPADPRVDASPACLRAVADISSFELAEPLLGSRHQLVVDAFGAQHGGGPSPVRLVFSLVGLHLALDEGWSGDQVRDGHRRMAARRTAWPRPPRPSRPSWLTPGDVVDRLLVAAPEGRAKVLEAWAESVWQAWRAQWPEVRALAATALPEP